MDCLLLLSAIAGRAKQCGLAIATGIVSLPLRHPVSLAQSFATLDILSGGQLIIGVGEGSAESDFAALGVSFKKRRKMLEDGVVALRALLTNTGVSHEGPYYPFRGVTVTPRCIQRPCPPIWLSSWGSPTGMRRVARLGDGWVASAWHSTPEQFHSALRALNGALVEQGKDPKNFPNAVDTVFLYADPDRARARRIAVPVVERAMRAPFDGGAGHCLVGDYLECEELLQRWVEAGAQQLCVWPVLDPVRQIRRFGEHILQNVLNRQATRLRHCTE
jgi:alkanesulfonate monooxygenase SsuD/methylene tetrahydromethanopterin reductase-like flavin-dependent oxidoreductase (luciferase family)